MLSYMPTYQPCPNKDVQDLSFLLINNVIPQRWQKMIVLKFLLQSFVAVKQEIMCLSEKQTESRECESAHGLQWCIYYRFLFFVWLPARSPWHNLNRLGRESAQRESEVLQWVTFLACFSEGCWAPTQQTKCNLDNCEFINRTRQRRRVLFNNFISQFNLHMTRKTKENNVCKHWLFVGAVCLFYYCRFVKLN